MKNLNLLEKSILATVAYYDVLDYPMTGFEIFKYLINPMHIIIQSGPNKELEPIKKISYLKILKSLKNLSDSLRREARYIEEKNGYYFLKGPASPSQGGKKKLYETRIKRQKFSDQKWRKVRKIIKFIQAIPYIRMIALSGSMAFNNARKDSDIDLLIITKHKRIWTNRFLITFFVHIIGKRRHGRKTADRICLNHYITDESLKINFPSLYNAQTYAHLTPILEVEGGVYKKFQAANKWIKNYLINYPEQRINNQRLIKEKRFLKGFAVFQESILNTFLGNFLEKILKTFQELKIKRHSRKIKGEGRVITDDFQLEFHPDSPEPKVLDNYNKNMLKLGLRMNPEKDSGLFQKRRR